MLPISKQLPKILVASGGTNQGVTWKSILLIELSGNGVAKFGQTETYSDNCGVGEKNGKAEACRLFVKVGKTPVFYREAFVNKGVCDGGTWTKSGTPRQISLKEDETDWSPYVLTVNSRIETWSEVVVLGTENRNGVMRKYFTKPDGKKVAIAGAGITGAFC